MERLHTALQPQCSGLRLWLLWPLTSPRCCCRSELACPSSPCAPPAAACVVRHHQCAPPPPPMRARSIGMNKGGVGVSLQLDDTHLAFVSSHLAAHQSKTAARNADMAEIATNLHLPGAARGADLATGFHHVVWMGDLNYRLEYGQQVRWTHARTNKGALHAAACAVRAGVVWARCVVAARWRPNSQHALHDAHARAHRLARPRRRRRRRTAPRPRTLRRCVTTSPPAGTSSCWRWTS